MKKEKDTLRESILATQDLQFEEVSVPEWNFEGYIRALDGEARFRLSGIAAEAVNDKNVHMLEAYVCEGLFDQDKERVFTFEDRVALSSKNPDIVQRLYRKILRISKMDKESVDDTEKKSERATA